MSELTATALKEAYTDGYLRGQKKAYDECDEVARELSQIKTGCSKWLDEHDKRIRDDAIEEFKHKLFDRLFDDGLWKCVTENDIDEVAEQMKDGGKE